MPKYRLQLKTIQLDLIQKHSGIIKAPNLTTKLTDEVCKEVLSQITPKAAWEIFPYEGDTAKIISENGSTILQGKKIPHRLCKCHHVAVVAICLGDTLQETIGKYMAEGMLLKAIVMEDTGSAAINQIFELINKEIQKKIQYRPWALSSRYIIGYGDGDISHASELLDLVDGKNLGITIGKEGMIYPRQTLLALIGIYDKKLADGKPGIASIPCQRCPSDNCDFREQDYRELKEDWKEFVDKGDNFTLGDILKDKLKNQKKDK